MDDKNNSQQYKNKSAGWTLPEKNKFLRERFVQLSFAIKSSFWSAILYDVVLILHKLDHCRIYFHFVSHWCSGLHLHWQKHMLFSCNFSLLNRKGRASVSSDMLVRLLTWRTKQDGSLVFFFAICVVLGHQNSCLYFLCLTVLNWGKLAKFFVFCLCVLFWGMTLYKTW